MHFSKKCAIGIGTKLLLFAGLVMIVNLILPVAVRSQQIDARNGRGTEVYQGHCTACHATDLRGLGNNPPLIGPAFWDKWKNVPVGQLVLKVRNSMPPPGGHTLSEEDYQAVVSYLVQVNGGASAPKGGGASEGRNAAQQPLGLVPANAFANREVAGFEPVTEALLTKPSDADWLNWRRTRDAQAFSPLAKIDTSNVGKLKLAWSLSLADGAQAPTPLVHNGVMYVTEPGGTIVALNAGNGDVIWRYRYKPADGERPVSGSPRNLAIFGTNLFLATSIGTIAAIDARNGSEVWRTTVGLEPGFGFSSGPMIAHGIVIIGAGGCAVFRTEKCFIAGLDPETGAVRWRTSTIAEQGDPNDASWGGRPATFRAGGDSWIPGSYDAKTDTYLVGTSQAKPWFAVSRGMNTGDAALYSNSTLALDPQTGKMKWYHQHIPGESLDLDTVYERVLVDLGSTPVLLTIGKDGILWKLNRNTGTYLGHKETVYQDVYSAIDPKNGKITYRKDIADQKFGTAVQVCPGNLGGHNWQASAYNPQTETLIAPLLQMCGATTPARVEFTTGRMGLGIEMGADPHLHVAPGAKGLGKLAAFDARTLTEKWRIEQAVPFTSAALATAGNVIFVGDGDRRFTAYDVKNGKLLWQTRLPAAPHGFPITYSVAGKQFVAVPAGQIGFFKLAVQQTPGLYIPPGGNGIYVFALD